jgi:flagellar hook-associated protein 1
MSDLMSLLHLGAAGLAAQNAGVSIATNNVANVNTRGYSRQRVDLESLLGAPLVGGVRSGDPQRMADRLLAGRMHTAAGSLAMSQAFADALARSAATPSSRRSAISSPASTAARTSSPRRAPRSTSGSATASPRRPRSPSASPRPTSRSPAATIP